MNVDTVKTFFKNNKNTLIKAFAYAIGFLLLFRSFDALLVSLWDSIIAKQIIIPIKINDKEGTIGLIYLFVTVVLTVQIIKRAQPPKWLIRSVLIISLAYIYFTIFYSDVSGSIYTFQNKYLHWIRYSDFIFIFTICSVIWAYREWFSKSEKPLENKSIFSLEQLAEDNKYSDDHKREGKTRLIADQILLIECKQAFGIGIVGSWGSGKTYFISMITRYIREKAGDSTNIIQFTPWVNTETRSITELFLEKLSNEIEGEASKKVKEYSKKIFETSSGVFSDIVSLRFSSDAEISTEGINTAIVKSGKKLIVVIDDIDRLNEKEVIEVFRLIRNTANFSNTIYLVAYDRVYVDDILRKVSEDKNSEYINKIIQFEYYLAAPKPTDLKTQFYELFKSAVLRTLAIEQREKLLKYLEETLLELRLSNNSHLDDELLNFDDLITNTRDVHKIVNAFLFSLISEKEKAEIVYWPDLLFLEAIKLKAPQWYEKIRTKKILRNLPREVSFMYKVELNEAEESSLLRDKKVHKTIYHLFSSEYKGKENRVQNADYFDWYFESDSAILMPSEKQMIKAFDPSGFHKLIKRLIIEKPKAIASFVNDIKNTEDALKKFILCIVLWKNKQINITTLSYWYNVNRELTFDLSFKYLIEVEIESTEEADLKQMFLLLIDWGQGEKYVSSNDWLTSIIPLSRLRVLILQKGMKMDEIALELKHKLFLAIQKEEEALNIESSTLSEARKTFIYILKKQFSLEYLYRSVLYFYSDPNVFKENEFYADPEINTIDTNSPRKIKFSDEMKWLERRIDFEELILRSNSSYFQEWLLVAWRRFKENNFKSALVHEECVIFSSNIRSVSLRKKGSFIDLITKEFNHKEFQKEKHSPRMPALFFIDAKTITQNLQITDIEAREGGFYEYLYSFELVNRDHFGGGEIYVFVDDECWVDLNGYEIGQKKTSFFGLNIINEHLKSGANTLKIIVENWSGPRIGDPLATGISNPYALRFMIVLRPKKKLN